MIAGFFVLGIASRWGEGEWIWWVGIAEYTLDEVFSGEV
jgi:hypothetical protein